ncbi:transcriptional regulator [Corynebacterium bovis]|uniref:Transcriptional regulator n=1 Tax=Corynebacterium bovis TaxID=36808 RepID=A0A3R8R102_9CORY|nr:transcriptional regulator [Corynebacterium bovis]MDN8578329.1 transcriptional regulator [Corynebacterium bovis]RRO85704.1 transcriptional regulator [Corynebacterium bovis]RRQ06190.1 transcriptional regulator [Corynebacterium bovis]RRQ09194.1 transcriptional regulator [Corynebacterium bovis]
MTTYTAEAARDNGWWVVQLREDPGVLTQARRLDQIPETVRDALVLFPDLEPDPGQATIVVEVTDDNEAKAALARDKTKAAQTMRDEATQLMRQTVHELSEGGLSLMDIGTLLGVSYARAQQLARS